MEKNIIEKFEMIDGHAIIDTNFSLITANEDFYRFIGIATSISIVETIHQVDLDDFLYVCQHLKVNQNADMVIRLRRSDNSYRWMLLNITHLQHKSTIASLDYFDIQLSDIIAMKRQNKLLCEQIQVKDDINSIVLKFDDAISYCNSLVEEDPDVEFTCIIAEIDNYDDYINRYGEKTAASIHKTVMNTAIEFVNGRGAVFTSDFNKVGLIIKDINPEVAMRSFVESFRNEVSWNELVNNSKDKLSLSMGVSRYPQNSANTDNVIKKMYKALEICHDRGQGKYIIYREHLHGDLV